MSTETNPKATGAIKNHTTGVPRIGRLHPGAPICELGGCPNHRDATVYHPQRGVLHVCPRHAEAIQRLDEDRFWGWGGR